MTNKIIKLAKNMLTSAPRFEALESELVDVRVELQQILSLLKIKSDFPAIPPKNLQIRVAGAYNARFFDVGQRIVTDIVAILRDHGHSLSDKRDVLDFGCGCGRVLIPLSFVVPAERISGTDIDRHAIRWLQRNCPSFNRFDVNRSKPPVEYADETFDFIYGISVFTHLPEKLQRLWLGELSRIMKPGGIGLFTTHGEKYFGNLPDSAKQELTTKGFHYSVGLPTDGLPEYYQTSFQTVNYVSRVWSKYFDVLEVRQEGINNNQDAVLVRKRS
jgi:SAM-dependent methyltransferase